MRRGVAARGFCADYCKAFGVRPAAVARIEQHVEIFFAGETGQKDAPELPQIKG